MNPSAWLNAVTLPEPLAVGIGGEARARSSTSETMRYSVRPRSEGVRTARVAGTVSCSLAGRPAMARIIGATNAWKVKIAEVGKPGSTTTGRPSVTAMHKGLPGLSATPWTTIAWVARAGRPPGGRDRRRPSRCRRTAGRCRAARRLLQPGRRARRGRPGRCPSGTGCAALLRDRGAEDRGVGIVDLAGPDRLARRHQLVAGRDDGHGRPAMDRHLGAARPPPACRSRARSAPRPARSTVSPRRDVAAGGGERCAGAAGRRSSIQQAAVAHRLRRPRCARP